MLMVALSFCAAKTEDVVAAAALRQEAFCLNVCTCDPVCRSVTDKMPSPCRLPVKTSSDDMIVLDQVRRGKKMIRDDLIAERAMTD